MSRCYGILSSDMTRTERTKRGSQYISAHVKTWTGWVRVTLREDDTASIECQGVDVTLNGNDLFKRRQLPEEMSVAQYLELSKAIWKREAGSLRNFPHKEFASLFERMSVSKLVTEA